jgi:hypothetical protein
VLCAMDRISSFAADHGAEYDNLLWAMGQKLVKGFGHWCKICKVCFCVQGLDAESLSFHPSKG